MRYNKTISNTLIVWDSYNIPSDISFIIYKYVINFSAQVIINKWFSYIIIHNSNLSILVNKLFQYYSDTSSRYYYDVTDPNVYKTFKICLKYIKPNISSESWWINQLNYAINGFYVLREYKKNSIYICLLDIIYDLYCNKFKGECLVIFNTVLL